jgi:uncharacterized repeat protein (TIGR03803 family)
MTGGGGSNNVGTVFELSPPVAGQTGWSETVLLTFNGKNGAYPSGALLADGAGNLYGTTEEGGNNKCPSRVGCGVVFELSPPSAGQTKWTETVLFSFHKSDGAAPLAGLIADGAGNLFGTTYEGGMTDHGLAFELSPPVAGRTAWTETVLRYFGATNGKGPSGVLLADGAGNLYGTTNGGGKNRTGCPGDKGCGVVFELSPPATGQTTWTETVLYVFKGTDGEVPTGGLVADGVGNIFGTAAFGGKSKACASALGCGLVFELSPPAAGGTAWTETLLASFNGTKGQTPYGGLIRDGAGNLYGTTELGGTHGDGVVFEVTP